MVFDRHSNDTKKGFSIRLHSFSADQTEHKEHYVALNVPVDAEKVRSDKWNHIKCATG